MRRFVENREGNFAIVLAIASMPVFASVGVAVDYSRASNVKSFAQSLADSAALNGAQLGPDGNYEPHLDHLRSTVSQRYQINGLEVTGRWLSEVDFRVDVRASLPVTFLSAVPVMPDKVPFTAGATARIADPSYIYDPPTVTELDYDAGDYNRIYVYCFDPTKVAGQGQGQGQGQGNFKHARTEPIPIADNGGTVYDFEMPRCEGSQVMSYKLLNVRHVRTQPHLWNDPSQTRFEFYTDTVLDEQGAEEYDIKCVGNHCNNQPAQGWNILETVLCDSKEECVPESEGGIIPEGKHREPERATEGCSPGKYMYYGWEDRPPGMSGPSQHWTDIAWTDQDYDDIRVVIGCPRLTEAEERMVRLVR